MSKEVTNSNTLHVAPYYKLKGGIASLIQSYRMHSEIPFRYFYTMYFSNKLLNVLVFPFLMIQYLLLIINPSILIVHLHCATKGSFYRKYMLFRFARLFNKKVIFHIHSGEFDLFYSNANTIIKRMIDEVLIKSEAVIVLTNYWKEYFSEKFTINNLIVVNNCIAFQEKKEKKFNNKLHLLFLGKIGYRKGIFDLIDSIKKYKDKFSGEIRLFIGGDGETKKLQKKIKESELENEITYVGWIRDNEKKELLEKCDVMILPTYFEGLSITLLEGMSFSKPLISTNVGAAGSLLINKKNGIKIKGGDLDDIANAIQYYIDNKKMIKIHGDESYKIVKDYFPEVVFKQLYKLYNNI